MGIINENIGYQDEIAAEERRASDEWNLNGNCPKVGLEAHAVLAFLVDEGEVEELTDEEKFRISELYKKIEEIEQSNSDEDIGELENEIFEIKSGKIDVYDIIPIGEYIYMTEFQVINAPGIEGNTYIAGDDYDTHRTAKSYLEDIIDDTGLEGFSRRFLIDHIDEEEVERYARDMYTDFVYEEPDSYVSSEYRQLSTAQEEEISIYKRKISQYESMIEQYNLFLNSKEYDENVKKQIIGKINEFEELIDTLNSDIEYIEGDPDGDYTDEGIEDAIDTLVDDAIRDSYSFITEYGLELKNFIDQEGLIDAIIDSDGYGHTLGRYDGNMPYFRIKGETIYVARVD